MRASPRKPTLITILGGTVAPAPLGPSHHESFSPSVSAASPLGPDGAAAIGLLVGYVAPVAERFLNAAPPVEGKADSAYPSGRFVWTEQSKQT